MMMIITTYFLYFVGIIFVADASINNEQPHVILIIADDMGWNDVSYHGSAEIPTPNIDALAASGIILNKHYTAQQCTPSRASLMTGRYPSNTGLQHYVIHATEPAGLPLEFKIMPQYFKKLGYATHLVGKWHLGYYKKEFTPTYRGFDSFFGYWNGVLDYFDHTNNEFETAWGVDLHSGTEPVYNLRGRCAAELFTEKAEQIIDKHNSSEPLFLMLSQIAPHTGNEYQRLQAPAENVARFKHIKDLKRRIYAGAVSLLDDSVGRVFEKLHEKGMLDNSVVLFFSDNGAEPAGYRGAYGSNWPLRGAKMHLWEGGVRTPAVIWSPLLGLKEPRTWKQIIHISDWLPTLYAVAGGKQSDLGETDGMNMWQYLKNDLPSPRTEVLLNVDPVFGLSSLIQGDYKLVNGTFMDRRDSWYMTSGKGNLNISSLDEWVWKKGSVVKDILEKTERWIVKTRDEWRKDSVIDCGVTTCSAVGLGRCNPEEHPCLFNIAQDPCEYVNLASTLPKVVTSMMKRMQELNSTSVEPVAKPIDPRGDPRCHGFAYVSWLDEEHRTECYDSE